MINIKNVAIGWGRWLKLLPVSKEVHDESERRLLICEVCDFAKPSEFLEDIGDGMESVKSMYCSKCMCPCHQKSLTDEQCPLGKWEIK